MTDATDSAQGTDPDRAGFTTTLAAARDQLVLTAGVVTGTDMDLVGTIGRHLLPARRVRPAMRATAPTYLPAQSPMWARGPSGRS